MGLLSVKNPVLKHGIHYLTSDYKSRNEDRKNHNGMDLVGANGVDEVIAIESGIVTYVGYDNSAGYWVAINTNGIEHRYFHLKKGSILVKKGEYVHKGQVIATMGRTGNATGNNLHFAIYKDGHYVDPLPYLMNDNPFNIDGDAFTTFVKGIQKCFGARVDGIPGPETLSKTRTISTSINWNSPAVRVLQVYLQTLGYNLGIHGVDGMFGPDMKKVIKDYQKNVVGLTGKYVDGIITARMYTWQSLLRL